jgi:hypothetical protein
VPLPDLLSFKSKHHSQTDNIAPVDFGVTSGPRLALMARMDGVSQIDAGEDGEHVGLEECDQKFERHKHDGHCKREYRADPSDKSDRAEHSDESGEDAQRDVPSEHVGEQPYAVRKRSSEK